MVVTRRTPAVPTPVSRTQSSQSQPRSVRASVIQGTSVTPPVSSPLASGDAHTTAINTEASNDFKEYNNKDEHKKLKKKDKRKKSVKKQRKLVQSLLDFFTKLLLLAFTIYAFTVCPRDDHLQSPLCRGLSEYKRIILDPYVVPPLQTALAHPSIAPYVARVTEVASPILLRTQVEWNTRFIPQWQNRIVPAWNNHVVTAFKAHAVPQWEKRVVPQWQRHVVPQYEKHIVRRLSKLEPLVARAESYVKQAEEMYTTRIAPHVRTATYNLQRWQQKSQPYILLAIQKTQDSYHAAKPHAMTLAKRIVAAMRRALLFLREQSRIFVDPHVAKLWEKVEELSRGSPATSVFTSAPSDAKDFSSPELVVSESSEPESNHAPPVSPIPAHQPFMEKELNEATETMEPEMLSNEDATTAADIEEPAEPEFFDDVAPIWPHPSQSTSAVYSHSTSNSVAPPMPTLQSVSSILSHTASTASSVVFVVADKSSSSIASAIPTGPYSSVSANIGDDDEIDMSAFYAELGLDEPLAVSQSQEQVQVPLNPPESEEERKERLRRKAEETARKRADIEARHSKWEAELRSQMETGTSTLKGKLEALRSTAAGELAEAPEIREAVENLVADSEKYIKGAEVYLKNLKAENRKNDEKMSLWERVVEKVGAKFSERLGVTEVVVNAWYGVILNQELREVSALTIEVREIAEKAQVDLGLDYAWLDDVTYSDWQRYHSLMDASEKFAQEANSIQNGTHASLSIDNPIIPIFEDLESEVQDVVIGFETRLRRIKRDGERAFNSVQKDEDKGSPTDPEPGVEPEVSILPIREEGESERGYIPPVIIGRSKEEVLEALGKVEPVEVQRSGSRAGEDAEEIVSSLVREAEKERSESSGYPRNEL